MNLRPCESCQRHVEVGSSACPFCAAAQTPRVASSARALLGRVSRAAVFASAAACASSTPHAAPPPPPPPPDPAIVQKFATAPPPAEGKASVRGFLTREGQPIANEKVIIRNEAGDAQFATSGAHGEFEFVDLAPGSYYLNVEPQVYDPYIYSRRFGGAPMAAAEVRIEPGQNRREDIRLPAVSPPVHDNGPCCKPYGAPPARRRVV